jgi:anti-sigma regulatory factor (Ser/Thr protein kinase)
MEKYFKDENDVGMRLSYDVIPDDFSRAGEASSKIKKVLKQLAIDATAIRRVAIGTYEAEINLVIHSSGGTIEVFIKTDRIEIYIEDKGPGIENIELAMTKGYSTASSEVREMGFGAGMGLPNMEKVSDDFVIESEVGFGTQIKMTIYYSY